MGIRVSKHTLSFLRFLWEPSISLSCIFHLVLFPHIAYCKSGQLYQAIMNLKNNRVCVCVRVSSAESYLEQSMLVAVLA